MPTPITIQAYTYDELGDKAKERARDWFREVMAQEPEWWDSTFDEADRFAEMLGITIDRRKGRLDAPAIYFSGFASQGDGACFTGRYRYKAGAAEALKAEAPQDETLQRIALGLEALQREHDCALTAEVTHTGRYLHAYSTTIEVMNGDEPADDGADKALSELLRDYVNWIYRQLEAEDEDRLSDESLEDGIRANEYTFTEDGKRFPF